LNDVVVGKHSIVGAGSVVHPGTQVTGGTYWEGKPAKFVREVMFAEVEDGMRRRNLMEKLARRHWQEDVLSQREKEVRKKIDIYFELRSPSIETNQRNE